MKCGRNAITAAVLPVSSRLEIGRGRMSRAGSTVAAGARRTRKWIGRNEVVSGTRGQGEDFKEVTLDRPQDARDG